MLDKIPSLLCVSMAALSLALSQAAQAQTDPAPASQAPAIPAPPAPAVAAPALAVTPAAPATQSIAAPAPAAQAAPALAPPPPAPPMAPAPAAPATPEAGVAAKGAPTPAEAAHAAHAEAALQRMEERYNEMMAKRKQRYEDLRKRAEAAGLTLPETPPWEEPGFTPPEKPAMPERPSWAGMSGMEGPADLQAMDKEWQARREQAWQAMRERAAQRGVEIPDQGPWNLETPEEHRAHMEKMMNATPEERAAQRDQHWAEMRERAAAKGITMPETPPWKEAEQRREAMKAKWENYRKVIDQMSAEQREAAEAIFGQMPQPPEMPAMPVRPEMPAMPPRPEMGRELMPPMPFGQDFGAPGPQAYPPMGPGQGGPGYAGPGHSGPGYGGPGFGGPGFGGPGYGGPGYGEPGYGGPGLGAPPYGGPGYGDYDQRQPWMGANPGNPPAPMMMPNSGYHRW